MQKTYVITIPKTLSLKDIFTPPVIIKIKKILNEPKNYLDTIKNSFMISEGESKDDSYIFYLFLESFREKELIIGEFEINSNISMMINVDCPDIKKDTKNYFQQKGLIHKYEDI